MANNVAWLFYSGDWRKDPELCRCTKAEKGVWIDSLAILDGCPVRGVFCSADGTPWSDEDVARAIGGDIAENMECLAELLRKGVAHRNPKGAIYSRRMVRDSEKRAKEKLKKKNQRSSVPDVVPILVPPLSESETEREVDVGFDFDIAFESLFAIYPKRKDSPLVRQYFIDAIGKVSHRHRFGQSEASSYIIERAKIYASRATLISGMDKFLYEQIYEQDPDEWEQKSMGNPGVDMAIGSRRDGPWTDSDLEAK